MRTLALRQNVGTVDRLMRLALGLTLAVYPALAAWQGWAVAALATVAGSQLVAGLTGY